MNARSIALTTLLVCIVLVDATGSAQSGGTYKVDAGWAQLPQGADWGGNTTWITADGKGNVVARADRTVLSRVHSRRQVREGLR